MDVSVFRAFGALALAALIVLYYIRSKAAMDMFSNGQFIINAKGGVVMLDFGGGNGFGGTGRLIQSGFRTLTPEGELEDPSPQTTPEAPPAPTAAPPSAIPATTSAPRPAREWRFQIKKTAEGRPKLHLNGVAITIKGVNWLGFNDRYMIPGELWKFSMQSAFAFLKKHGFNAVKLHVSADFIRLMDDPKVLVGANANVVDRMPLPFTDADRDCDGKTPWYVLRKFIDLADTNNMLVMLCMSNFDARRPQPEAAWFDTTLVTSHDTTVNKEDIRALCVKLVDKCRPYPHVFAIDMKSEPWGMTWGAWKEGVEYLGRAVLDKNPGLLISVGGVANSGAAAGSWGQDLGGAKDKPIVLQVRGDDRVIYSVTILGPDVPGSASENWIANGIVQTSALEGDCNKLFEFLGEQGAFAIVGKWGGYMGTCDTERLSEPRCGKSGTADMFVNRVLAQHLGEKGYDNFFWCLNANDQATGGLVDGTYDFDNKAYPIKLEVTSLACPRPTAFDFTKSNLVSRV